MCGVAGVIGRSAEHVTGDFADMLRHRGPDGHNSTARAGDHGRWMLTHTRLAIVDLSASGAQPISNEDESLWLSFNGEIYNSNDLRSQLEGKGHVFRSRMDGEVILHLFEDEGIAGFAKLNGIFAFALANASSGEVVLCRDPVGVKPLFYCRDGGGAMHFSSEIEPLRRSVSCGELDPQALAQFLTFLWIPSPRTPYRDIRSLMPGEALIVSDRGATAARYGPPLFPSPDAFEEQDLAAFEDSFLTACRRQLMADVPLALMASGGVDSSLLWWGMKDDLKEVLTIEWEAGGHEKLEEDALTVRELEHLFGSRVTYVAGPDQVSDVPPPSGDLIADPAYALTTYIARAVREMGLKVLFSGQGGDELFGGYRRHAVAPLISMSSLNSLASTSLRAGLMPFRRNEFAVRLLRAVRERDFFRGYMRLCSYSTSRQRAAALGCMESEVDDETVWEEHRRVYEALPGGLSPLRRAMSIDLNVYMPGLGLTYADRAGMAHGVEVRVPWLDLELIRWSLSLPDHQLVRRLKTKLMPKSLAAKMLPAAVGSRAKRGFAMPAERLPKHPPDDGGLGFRQGSYFEYAKRMMESYCER
jgi:asparagine synthase (glutamine-hydrolysing)